MEPDVPATEQPHWRPAQFFSREGNGVRCTLCPHLCNLRDGETGICGARRRIGDIIETASYSATVIHLDSIEKKPFYHYRPGRPVLTVGAPGCSMACRYCQNYRLSQAGKPTGLPWRAAPLEAEDLATRARIHNAAVGFSYSEASLASELTIDVARLGKAHGIDVVWKTNGFLTQHAVETVAPYLSAVNIDIKAADENRHRRLTGAALAPILETFRYLASSRVWVEVSTPMIPDVNADAESVRRIANWIAEISVDIPWHLVRFNPDFGMMQARPTLPSELDAAVEIAKDAGLNYVYVERSMGGRDTTCPNCHAPVVQRDIWRTTSNVLINGGCPACGTAIAGKW